MNSYLLLFLFLNRYHHSIVLTKKSAKVCRAETWILKCRETSSSLTKGLIITTRSSDHKPSVNLESTKGLWFDDRIGMINPFVRIVLET